MIIAFIRFIFNALLLLLILALLALILTHIVPLSSDTAAITIESGTVRPRLFIDAQTRALQAILLRQQAALNTPLSSDSSPLSLTIYSGETALAVAEKLEAMGLISDPLLFTQLLYYNTLDTRLRAGRYRLRRNMTMRQIGAALTVGQAGQPAVTIPPGWRLEQIADYLTAARIMDGARFLEEARRGSGVEHIVLSDRPPGHSYEGYLFPGSYDLPPNPTPADLIRQMLNTLAGQLPSNAFALADRQGLTLHEVLTLASIVERETALAIERPLVASVYLNRLDPTTSETHLRADPTVQYAMGYQPVSGQWWKSPVSLEEYGLVDSPYNTYLYPGLPPAPIANPSLDSIMAVLYPAETDYLFFVCRRPRCEGGTHVFAETYEEHLQNVAVYWEQ